MKKHIIDFKIVENRRLHDIYSLLILTPTSGQQLPPIKPGQFVQVAIDNSKTTFLRRPISINFVDYEANQLWLLVRKAGDGTSHLINMKPEESLNIILPLGNGFSIPADKNTRLLLTGGGVGIAPMLYLGQVLKEQGFSPEFLIGARSAKDILQLDILQKIGTVHISTEDGSLGEKGLVTTNTILSQDIDLIYCCGPAPMMKAIANVAKNINAQCEVSLENMMACGVGACLCCVENTVKGNVCVCTEGPVFNINQLTW